MQGEGQTVCIRCGKMRVVSRKWKDQTDGKGPVLSHVQSVCPDPECQKLVDEKFTKIREQREQSEERRKSVVLARRLKVKE